LSKVQTTFGLIISDIPSMPENVTIGAENTWGDIGVSYFVDGEDNLPTFISDNGY